MGRDERENPFNRFRQAEGRSSRETYDRNGRLIGEGDIVHLIGKGDVMWRVTSVKPVMDPKAPPGLVELALVAAFVTGVPGGQNVMDVIKCKDATEVAPPVAIAQGDGDGGGLVKES